MKKIMCIIFLLVSVIIIKTSVLGKEYDSFRIINTTPENLPIVSFDVNEYGDIVLGFSDNSQKYISVYNSVGENKINLTFTNYGSFGVEWEENKIAVYLYRGTRKYIMELDGKYVLSEIDDESFVQKEKDITSRTQVRRAEVVYQLTDISPFTNAGSKLLVTYPDGTVLAFYNASKFVQNRTIVYSIMLVIFVGLIVVTVKNYWGENN